MRRSEQLGDLSATGKLAAHLTIVLDMEIAEALREARTGGRSLREAGFTATADELERWRPA